MIRDGVRRLIALGPMPPVTATTPAQVDHYGALIDQIAKPVTDEEARALLSVFGGDDYFGAAWSLLYLIETAPQVPLDAPPPDDANEWVRRIWQRAENARVMERDV